MTLENESAHVPSADDGTSKDSRRALVENQLMEQASILFAQKGYAGTTLTDIADRVGLTRAAVYYYFRNKEALLEAIVSDLTDLPLREIRELRETGPESAAERLYLYVKASVRRVLGRQIPMKMIQVTEANLPPETLARHNEAKREILAEHRSILRDGMKSGEFRVHDDRVAALAIIGMVNWTTNWFAPGRGQGLDAVAEQIAEMAVRSVAASSQDRGRPADAKAALAAVREDLEQLALLIEQEAAAD